MTPLRYVPPGEIDGDPQEVEEAVKRQLVGVIDESIPQLRNSFMSRVLREEPGTAPSELAELWEESDEKAGIDRIRILAEAL